MILIASLILEQISEAIFCVTNVPVKIATFVDVVCTI